MALRQKTRTFLTVGVVLFLCVLFSHPEDVMRGSLAGLTLWYQAVLPVQLPFMIVIQLLLRLQVIRGLAPSLLCLLSGLTCGYPAGTVTAAALYQSGAIPEKRLTRLAAGSSTAGPLFMVGTVGLGLLSESRLGYLLLSIQWLCAALLVLPGGRKHKPKQAPPVVSQPLGQMLGDAVGAAAQLMLTIAGFIVLFSVILQWVPSWIGALLEMTNGAKIVAASSWPLAAKLVGISFLLGFSGVCVILQSLAAAERAPIAAGRFVLYKVAQGGLAAVLTWGVCQFLGL